jgi:hypothetical protein
MLSPDSIQQTDSIDLSQQDAEEESRKDPKGWVHFVPKKIITAKPVPRGLDLTKIEVIPQVRRSFNPVTSLSPDLTASTERRLPSFGQNPFHPVNGILNKPRLVRPRQFYMQHKSDVKPFKRYETKAARQAQAHKPNDDDLVTI